MVQVFVTVHAILIAFELLAMYFLAFAALRSAGMESKRYQHLFAAAFFMACAAATHTASLTSVLTQDVSIGAEGYFYTLAFLNVVAGSLALVRAETESKIVLSGNVREFFGGSQ